MEPYTLTMKLTGNRARLLLTHGPQELMRASLPAPAAFWTGKPAKALLESLSLWLDTKLRVVLDADDTVDGFSLELTDELGIGSRTLFYEVVVVERRGRRRPARLRGIDDFRDLHQLCLLDRLDAASR